MLASAVLLVSCLLVPSMQQGVQPPYYDRICHRIVDMVFVLDGSNSVGQDNFDLMIDTVQRAVGALEFGPNRARVGAVLYSYGVDAVIDLQDNIYRFRTALERFIFPDESTYTDRGIKAATEVLLRASPRENCPHVMMVITDGESSARPKTQRESILAKSHGIDLWAVGVGQQVNVDELEFIASGGANQTFLIDSFQRVPDRLVDMTREVCRTSHTRPTFIPTFPTTPSPTIPHHGTTLAPTNKPNFPEDLCKNAPRRGGVGYESYPGRCDMVIQCYYDLKGQVISAVTRRCPVGKFWNQTTLECADSWTVMCPHDPCAHCDDGVTATYESAHKSVAIPGQCRSYYECRGGKTYPGCCPAGSRFDKHLGCTRHGAEDCRDACGMCKEGTNICEKIPARQNYDIYNLYLRQMSQLYPMPCKGGKFNVYRCACTEPQNCRPFDSHRSVPGNCNGSRDSYLTFPNTVSWGTNRSYTFQFSLVDPNAELHMVSTCKNVRRLRVFRFDNRIMLELSVNNTVLASTEVFINPNSYQQQVPVTVVNSKDVLTLQVQQDSLEHTSSVGIPEGRCDVIPCEVSIAARSSGRVCNPINSFNAYDCLSF